MFPDPEEANPDGIVAMGGDLRVETLEEAYSKGIFPWPHEGFPLLWFSPAMRGVLKFSKFKVPKSTQKKINQQVYEVKMNTDFKQVIENCAKIPRSKESGTWILPEMKSAYLELFKQGNAFCVEAWQGEKMVGGLYGVQFRNVFSGESMFFKKSEASKICLVALVEKLKTEGHQWIDIQMVTPLLEQFGGEYISRKQFLMLLKQTQQK